MNDKCAIHLIEQDVNEPHRHEPPDAVTLVNGTALCADCVRARVQPGGGGVGIVVLLETRSP